MSDTHKVHTDALATLGTIITDGGRDAIHLAVEPVEAGCTLWPGQHIGFTGGKAHSMAETKLGIVDPFLVGPVHPGERFWLIVYPRTITSLRHVWEHPGFTAPQKEAQPDPTSDEAKKLSEQWLRDWCENTEDAPTYEHLLKVLTDGDSEIEEDREYYGKTLWRKDGDYLFANGIDAHGEIPHAYEVKHHVEIVTGKKILSMPQYFSCPC